MLQKILRIPKVLDASGHAKSTLYSQISKGLFTPQIKIGPRASGWPESEVAMINAARIAGKSDDEIKALVRDLVANRMESYEREFSGDKHAFDTESRNEIGLSPEFIKQREAGCE